MPSHDPCRAGAAAEEAAGHAVVGALELAIVEGDEGAEAPRACLVARGVATCGQGQQCGPTNSGCRQ
jgi:hypothetical protein